MEWHPLRTSGLRPVPEPVATPFVWTAAFVGSFMLMAALSGVDGSSGPTIGLAALCVFAALLGLPARFTAAPGTALVCWMFLNGFIIAPRGELSWQGHPDAARIGLLLGAAFVGTLLARIINAAGAHRRVTPGREPE
ncbi:hypothetical protein [Streptomyces cupreus]|uniref:DUF4118 domain-containing protein n=1 Tax=Streptomyces cupreus TaxID=2759956 RepID=A0A7X1J7T0_9ACTN|nr:hypothetical protein [Streptomyces cupreus]MBC2904742.1 hypothetical protein [Streptomyces cupreus]